MLSVKLGNFLTQKQVAKAKYEYNKPVISLVAFSFLTFSLTALVISGLALSHTYFNKPIQTFDKTYFEQAQKLNTELNRNIAITKEARPQNIDICNIVQNITQDVPSDISIKEISVTPQNYSIKGETQTIEAANKYVSSLDFGKQKATALDSISNNNKESKDFVISVKSKAKVAPKAQATAQGGK